MNAYMFANSKHILVSCFILGTLIFTSGNQVLASDGNAKFESFKKTFLKEYWDLFPGSASYKGLVEFDSILVVPSDANRTKVLKQLESLGRKLQFLGTTELSPINKTDLVLMRNEVESAKWYLSQYKSFEWDPSNYNVGYRIDHILSNSEKSSEDNIKRLNSYLSKVPAYYDGAMASLSDKPSLKHLDLAIKQTNGTLRLLEEPLEKRITKKEKVSKRLIESIKGDQERALKATTKYLKYLEKLKSKVKEGRSFRLGKSLYESKFKYDIVSEYNAGQLHTMALAEKRTIHQKMRRLTMELWPKYFPKDQLSKTVSLEQIGKLISKISEQHVSRGEFVNAIRKQLPELTKFVEKHDLLYLDPNKPLEVRETPEYMRGVAGASISAPGPFEKDRPTYYNVTPLDHYTEKEAESYLREYNDYMLQILNIHEAIPGHYAQLVYSNNAPSTIKKIFGNGTMIEGWACYTERMMLEEGYGNDSPELWLMYYKWNLRILSNFLLDYGVHVTNMDKTEAMKLLVDDAFQEATEAEGKWNRVQLTQVQLCSYYTGLTEIYKFREAYKKLKGEDFSLKSFHETFLSFGSAPVKEIKKLMAPGLATVSNLKVKHISAAGGKKPSQLIMKNKPSQRMPNKDATPTFTPKSESKSPVRDLDSED